MTLSTTRGHRIITIFLSGSPKVHQEQEFSHFRSWLPMPPACSLNPNSSHMRVQLRDHMQLDWQLNEEHGGAPMEWVWGQGWGQGQSAEAERRLGRMLPVGQHGSAFWNLSTHPQIFHSSD